MHESTRAQATHNHTALIIDLHQAKLFRALRGVGQRADGDVRVGLPVVVHKLHVVHAVAGWGGGGSVAGFRARACANAHSCFHERAYMRACVVHVGALVW